MSIIAAYMVPHPPMIIPQIGRGSEKQIEETVRAYEQIAGSVAALRPDTVIISSPHAVLYADYFHISPGKTAEGDFGRFGAPEVRFKEQYDSALVTEISRLAKERDFPAGILGERDRRLDHGVMVPLYFIEQKYRNFRLVRVSLSGFALPEHYEFGQLIRRAADNLGRRAVFVASGDLSHKLQPHGPYGFAPEGPVYDQSIMDICARGAFGEMLTFEESFCEKAAECGHRSFVIMAGALDGTQVSARVLSHQDVTGVGYGTGIFMPDGPDASRCFLDQYRAVQRAKLEAARSAEDAYVRLARLTVESFIRRGKKPDIPDWIPADMKTRRAGVFVSLHKSGQLRGCIGTFLPTRSCIAEEIIENAVSACSRDPRFDIVRANELDWLEISVDVLSAPERISGPELLDVKRYGVIVSRGARRGLLLPDLDGVDSVEDQIAIAKRKAGISPDEKVTLERFEVIRHK